MKRLVILTMLVLAGCSSAPTQMYRPGGYVGDAWRINAAVKSGMLTVQINDETVLHGSISDFKKDNVLYLPEGKYKGHTITANCYQNRSTVSRLMIAPFLTDWKVNVYVDYEQAAEF